VPVLATTLLIVHGLVAVALLGVMNRVGNRGRTARFVLWPLSFRGAVGSFANAAVVLYVVSALLGASSM
jgi:hypothetical protein